MNARVARVQGVRSVAVDVCALEDAASFYRSVWNLDPVESSAAARHFRGTGPHHHILSLHAASRPAIRNIVFEAADHAAVEAIHARVKASGAESEAPHDWQAPGGGFSFGFRDPEGRNLAVACGGAKHESAMPKPDRPHKVTHINLNAAINEVVRDQQMRELAPKLGFELDPMGAGTPEHAAEFLKAQLALWETTTKELGIEPQ